MGNITFDLQNWRKRTKDIGYKGSKASSAKLLGIDPHTYDRYERTGKVPESIRLAAMAILMGVK